jgi:hypothetical protein
MFSAYAKIEGTHASLVRSPVELYASGVQEDDILDFRKRKLEDAQISSQDGERLVELAEIYFICLAALVGQSNRSINVGFDS